MPSCRATALPVQLDRACRLHDPGDLPSVYKDFSLTYDAEKHVYRVSRRINGRVMVTNYDPAVLSNEERFLLHEQAEEAPFNDILVDIRPDTGWRIAVAGRIRLRSFHEIVTFIGRGIEEEPEFDVPRILERRRFARTHLIPWRSSKRGARRRKSICPEIEGLSVRGPAAGRLSMEPESFQPALSVVPDDRVPPCARLDQPSPYPK